MKFLLIFALIFSTFVGGGAQTPATADTTEFDVNGLKVIVKRRPSSPTVSAGLFVRGGVKNQTASNAGIENLTLTTATEASTKFPRDTMRRELSRMGSSIGAGSGYDFSSIALSTTRQNFDRTWEIFSDVVVNPSFTQASFDLVRERTLTALRNRTTRPDDALSDLETRVLYSGHPYSVDPYGTIETISAMKLADLKAYHKSMLQTSRLLLVVVGDVDPKVLEKQVVASFGKIPRGTYKDERVKQFSFEKPSVEVTKRTLPTNYVKGVFGAPSLADPDYYAMRVAMTILQSRVYQEVRVRNNLSYAPNAEMDNNIANTANIYVTANDANRSIALMFAEIDKLQNQTGDADDNQGLAGYFLTTHYLQLETNAAQVAELARYELIGGDWRRSQNFIKNIESVTPADIQAVARKYMNNIRFFVVGDPEAIDNKVLLRAETGR